MFQSFDLEANYCRLRISPDVTFAIGANVIAPGEEAGSQTAEMLGPGSLARRRWMRTSESWRRDAQRCHAVRPGRLRRRAWRIVDPVLKDGTPVYEYEPGTWGPKEVGSSVAPPGGWQNRR